MKGQVYPEIMPRGRPLTALMVKAALFVLGRGFQSVAAWDAEVMKEIDAWEEGVGIQFEVLPCGPYLLLRKQGGRLRMVGLIEGKADLVITFKNLSSAFLILTGQLGTPQGYAEHRMSVKGDLARAMSLIRCLNLVEFYLFPGFMAGKILKRLPPMTVKRFGVRLYVYLLGIPFGI